MFCCCSFWNSLMCSGWPQNSLCSWRWLWTSDISASASQSWNYRCVCFLFKFSLKQDLMHPRLASNSIKIKDNLKLLTLLPPSPEHWHPGMCHNTHLWRAWEQTWSCVHTRQEPLTTEWQPCYSSDTAATPESTDVSSSNCGSTVTDLLLR